MSMSSELASGIEDDDFHIPSRATAAPPPGQISAVQKMVSACSGSLITSFAVTPFDVVRIRLQQQEIMQTTPCCAPQTATAQALSAAQGSRKPGVFWATQQFCQSAKDCPKITSTFQGMLVISRNEGMLTLWRGLSLTLLMAVPSNIIYFTGYEYVRDISPAHGHPLNPLVCGMLARTISATVVSPFELLKTRLQSIPSGSTGNPDSRLLGSLLKDLGGSFRKNGMGSMFMGLSITLWRDVPFSGIYWSCYELTKARLSRALGTDLSDSDTRHDDGTVFGVSFVSGSVSGLIAAFFTNPFDVGKTRLQIATEKHTRPSMFRFLWQIYRNEGIGALYGGFAPRVMKIAPSCAIMISSYEIGKKIFRDNL